MFLKNSLVATLTLAMLIGMVGCSDDSTNPVGDLDDNTSILDPSSSTSVSGRVVDPYIVGAVLCEDVNKNASCDSREQKSTLSTEDGNFTFSNELTAGSHIIVETQGKHNGVEYDLTLSGIVTNDGTIDVVSPITTLETKGLTKNQIVEILTTAGISSLSATNIVLDPMNGLSKKLSITDDELKYLQSSLATYGLLKIMEASNTLSSLSAADIASSSEINQIATAMVTAIKGSLNQTTFNTIKTQMDTTRGTVPNPNFIPPVTLDVVIQTAVTVMDRVVEAGYNACNLSEGNVTVALIEANATMNQLQNEVSNIAEYYYGLKNRASLQNYQNYLSKDMQNGISNSSGVLKFDEENRLVEFDQQRISTESILNYIQLNGGTLGDSEINIEVTNSSVINIKIDDNDSKSYDVANSLATIPLSDISDGKNKLTLTLNSGSELYFYFFKGLFDAKSENLSYTGNTNYDFISIEANSTVAKDMFIRVDNNNNVNVTSDDCKILLLANDSGTISVRNLNSSGGHSIYSSNYEQWGVASANINHTGQDVNMTYSIALSPINNSTAISGDFLKIDELSGGQAVAFDAQDVQDSDIWLHPHYTHPTVTYDVTCNGQLCEDNVSNGAVWVATNDIHLGDYPSSYDFSDGNYTITELAGDHNYTILAFWLNKNLLGLSYPTGFVTSGLNSSGHDIVMQGISKDINGTLADPDTEVRIARVVMFAGQPVIHYSQTETKDSNNTFSINYQLDSVGTTSYILWGDNLELSATADCDGVAKCRTIMIGGDDDNSTDMTIP